MPNSTVPLRATGRLARQAFSAYALIGLHLVVIVAIAVAVLQFRSVSSDRAESREYISTADSLQVALLDAEIAVDSYVLTGNASDLDPLDSLLQAIEVHTEELGDHARDGDQHQFVEDLPALLTAKIDQWQRSVGLRQDGQTAEANQTIVDARNQAVLTAIRTNLDGIRAIESEHLSDYVDTANWLGVAIGVLSVALVVISLVVTGWLLVVNRRRHENEALRLLNASKDQFVGFVSHEIRRPLTIIEGNARQLERGPPQSPLATTAIGEITNATDRLKAIVATLLALSRAEAGGMLEVEPVMVQRIAERAAALHRTQFPMRPVQVATAAGTPPALGDRDAIEQVIVNLLTNAEKYGDAEAPIQVHIDSHAGFVTTSVRNYGPPQKQEQFERIFEPFNRGPASGDPRDGLGLGLTVSLRLVRAQGGQISAEALPDGACFRFSLPAAHDPGEV